ncbi:MFS transporter [Asticcacaulis biprosthecium]|uniref:MFS transporter n=1 Tax=Asticcacaulis biprosthecium TaxID=76891 RepID=UPI0002F06951|nr:MFS transporter [Asticcacaulis biprosthecium]
MVRFNSGGVRWGIIALLTVGTILNYLTRSTLSVAAPTLMTTMNMSEKDYGFITGVFQFGIMLQPIAGFVLDVVKLKMGMFLFALAWGVITMLHALAGNWQTLAWLRGFQGFAEGTAQPGGLKVVSEWFPAKERGFASGLYNIGASVGSMLAPPLVAFAILYYNWQAAFVFTGALGVLWAILWFFTYRSPQDHKALKDKEKSYILDGQEKHLAATGERPSMLKILKQRNFWGIAIPRFLADPTWSTLVFWMPLYLATVRGFDLKQIALFGWLPFVAADIGCLFGPFLVATFQRFGISLITARKLTFSVGAILMMGVVFVGFVESPYVAIALLCLGAFAHQTLSVTVITMSSDLFRQSEVATVAGMAGTAANLGALLFSVAIGTLVATTGYTPFFFILGGIDLLGALLLWFLVKPMEAARDQ